MDAIVRRLLESKSKLKLDDKFFSIDPNTSEANKLLDMFDELLSYHVRSIGKDIDIDDSNLKIQGDTITYKAQVYRFENGDTISLEDEENVKLQQKVGNSIKFPNTKKTGYDYNMEVGLSRTSFEITINREKY